MFRVNQSQTPSQALNGLLSLFNADAPAQMAHTQRIPVTVQTPEPTFATSQRRRRARRQAAQAGSGIRSTWF